DLELDAVDRDDRAESFADLVDLDHVRNAGCQCRRPSGPARDARAPRTTRWAEASTARRAPGGTSPRGARKPERPKNSRSRPRFFARCGADAGRRFGGSAGALDRAVEAALLPGRGVLVDHVALRGLVDEPHRLRQRRARGLGVARLDVAQHALHLGAHAARERLVEQPLLLVLADALLRLL